MKHHDYPLASVAVASVRVEGGSHAWPGSPLSRQGWRARLAVNMSHDIDAGELMWNFFKRFELP